MLRAFGHRLATCCGVIGSNLTISKLEPKAPNTSQPDGQTHAACCAQQCCDMLRRHVAIVWLGVNQGKARAIKYTFKTRFISLNAPAKRSRHANATYRNIVEYNMLRVLGRRRLAVLRCVATCWVLLAQV